MKSNSVFRIFFILLALNSSVCFASGTRTIYLDEASINTFHLVTAETLIEDARYLGSTKDWHLFALTQTSFSAGRPFDMTKGYKIALNNAEVTNGWILSDEDLKKMLTPANCPYFRSSSSKPKSINIILYQHTKEKCIF